MGRSVDRNDIDDALNLLWDMRGLAESILDNLEELSSMRDELVTSYEDALEIGSYAEGIERGWEGYTDDIESAETPIDNCANDIINTIEDLMGSIHDGLAELEEEEGYIQEVYRIADARGLEMHEADGFISQAYADGLEPEAAVSDWVKAEEEEGEDIEDIMGEIHAGLEELEVEQ